MVVEYEKSVDDKITSINREVTLSFEALYALKGLYDSSDHVTADEFKKIASEIFIRHNNIQALEWIPKVSREQRALFEKNRRKQYPDFLITERQQQNYMIQAKERDEYFPVYYVEPLTGNETAFGFDLGSNPKRLAALTSARNSGHLVATANIRLVQETSIQKAFLAFLPIYDGQPTTQQQRHNKLTGFVLAVIKIDDLVDSSNLHSALQGINFTLIDESNSPPEILYGNLKEHENMRMIYKKKLQPIGDRKWTMVTSPSAEYISKHRSATPIIIFLLTTTFIIFGLAYIYILARHSSSIERAVLERTLQLNEAKDELEKMTLLDSLTGVANRRHFDNYLKQEWARAKRYKLPLSLIMIDIDFFKNFNDHYGHFAGDSCLKTVSKIIERTVQRTTDVVARYGGEEFAIILPNTTDTYVLAELCRHNVEQEAIPHAYSTMADHVTISVGFTTITPTADLKIQKLINAADQALYKAKAAGRNRTCTL